MKRSKPLARKPMKKKAKPRMTKADREHLLAVKEACCLCCRVNPWYDLMKAGYGFAEAHHLKDGGRRRGHKFVIGLCPWHHRGEPPLIGMPKSEATKIYGPSLAEDARAFHALYGSDEELLAFQQVISCRTSRQVDTRRSSE